MHPRPLPGIPAPRRAWPLGLALAGTAVAVLPAGGAAAATMCTADNLYVVKGRLEGAAGNRFLNVRLTNVGDDACSAGAATKAGFRDFEGELGVKGALSGGSGAITLRARRDGEDRDPLDRPGAGPRRGLPRGRRDPRHASGAEPQAHLAAAVEDAGLHDVRVPSRLGRR